jgi:hypothetical protein
LEKLLVLSLLKLNGRLNLGHTELRVLYCFLSAESAYSSPSLDKTMSQKAVPQRPRRSKSAYRGLKSEIILKLIFSWAIAIAALTSAIKLLPYHLSQQEKLKELNIQVQDTEARVVKLQEQLNRNFDPQQTKNLMEQYSSLLAPNQSRIYWLPQKRGTDKN